MKPNGGAIWAGRTFRRSVLSSRSALREAAAAAEEQRGLLAADRDDRDDAHAELAREPDEALAAAEVDLGGLPARAVALVVAARVDEQRRATFERAAHVVRVGGHGSVAHERAPDAGHLEDEVVRELVEAALGPEVVVERLREDEGVGDQRPAGVVADQQHGLVGGDVLQALDVAAVVDVRQRPQRRERRLDVLGVARVQRVDAVERVVAEHAQQVEAVRGVGVHGGRHARRRRDRVEGHAWRLPVSGTPHASPGNSQVPPLD